MWSDAPQSAALRSAPAVTAPGVRSAAEVAEENLRRIMSASRSSLTQQFLRINRNRSGFCEPAELARIFKAANIELSASELRQLVSDYDTNKDGRVDINELAKALQADVARFEGHTARGAKRARG